MAVVEGSTLTPAELVALIEADNLSVDAGLELLDADDVLIEDISADFLADGSQIDRGVYRTIHGTARIRVSRELVWGSQRLRPYLLLSSDAPPLMSGGPEVLTTDEGVPLTTDEGEVLTTDGDAVLSEPTWYRWNLGVYLCAVPERVVGESPAVWDVECFDKLDILNTPHGSSYSLAAASNVVDAVEALIAAAGEAKVAIEASDVVSTSERVLSIIDDWTTLGICNELLGSIGHRALYVDRDGWFRSEPYRAPADLPVVWSYSADSDSTTVGEQRTSMADFYQAANTVIGVRDSVEDSIPVDGDGIYTAINQSDGPTSVDGRGGRIIRRVIRGEYASHASLVVAVDAALDTEKRVANYVTVSVSPSPVHGHFDVVDLRDDEIPVNGRFLVTDWSLPLDGSDMSLSLRGV